ncbi:MAG: hypothetical protein MI923_15845 [Phycisphaerales bacterium]|nr:hypothetical protein [Phycisphaerales bacterium]
MTNQEKFWSAMALLSCAIFTSGGCDTPTPFDPGPGPGQPDGEPDLTGVWRRESGELLSFSEETLDYLVLDEGGTLKMTFRNQKTNMIHCSDTVYARISDNALVLGYGGLQSQVFAGAGVMLYAMPDPETLELIEDVDLKTTFRREKTLPDESQCKSLIVEQTFDELAVFPRRDSGLAYDGTSLWVTDEATKMLYPIKPDSGKIGNPIQSDQTLNVFAIQGDDFWGVCDGCPVVLEKALAQRRTKDNGQVVDSVFQTELGLTANSFEIAAIAFDDAAKVLWLHGKFKDTNHYGFLKVNAEGPEPDKLLDSVEFDDELKSIASEGRFLWAITSYPQRIVQIDLETLLATATYEVPDSDIEWRGIAVVGSCLYLIGKDYRTNAGMLTKVSTGD